MSVVTVTRTITVQLEIDIPDDVQDIDEYVNKLQCEMSIPDESVIGLKLIDIQEL